MYLKNNITEPPWKCTPRKVIWKKNSFTSIYTDYFTIEIILKGMLRRQQRVQNITTRNLSKPGAWEVYENLTNKEAKDVEKFIEKHDVPMDLIMKTIKNKYKVKGTESDGLICSECNQEEIMTQSHCLIFSVWTEIKDGLDGSNISVLVAFSGRLFNESEKEV